MNAKDAHEIRYWQECDSATLQEELERLRLMRRLFPLPDSAKSVLEIGVGPQGGLLPFIRSQRKVGIDPLFSAYAQIGFRRPIGVECVEAYFESWESAETFEAIVCTNALDHGEMGFHTLPAITAHMAPGGRFFLHVHLRPSELLNTGHDHSLTVAQLDAELANLPLRELKRDFFEKDVDGHYCLAVVGIWERS
jgi:Methyltransferase domain